MGDIFFLDDLEEREGASGVGGGGGLAHLSYGGPGVT